MLTEPTKEKLYAMRLAAMAAAWLEQQQNPKKSSELSFDERFGLIVDAEHQARDNRRLARLIKNAQLRLPEACMEDFEASQPRGLDKPTARQLSACGWVPDHLNILVSGATGVGKSYLACALPRSRCLQARFQGPLSTTPPPMHRWQRESRNLSSSRS